MWWSAFILGIGGSLHCVGMCGPIVLALPSYRGETKKLFVGRLIYNFGRITTYLVMGAILGLIGHGIALAGFQQSFSILMGVFVLLILLFPRLSLLLNASHPVNKFNLKLKTFFGRLLKKKSFFSQFLIGIANGLLPCGLVYIALAGAIITGNFVDGAIYMALFGLGTLPMMLAISFTGNFIGLQLKKRLYKLSPYFVALIAVIFIVRGLNLGIPYLSPKVDKENVKVESCH